MIILCPVNMFNNPVIYFYKRCFPLAFIYKISVIYNMFLKGVFLFKNIVV